MGHTIIQVNVQIEACEQLQNNESHPAVSPLQYLVMKVSYVSNHLYIKACLVIH